MKFLCYLYFDSSFYIYLQTIFMRSVFLLLVFITSFAQAQVSDSFTDGNFTANPIWTGDGTEFTINTSQQLQLNNMFDPEHQLRYCLYTKLVQMWLTKYQALMCR